MRDKKNIMVLNVNNVRWGKIEQGIAGNKKWGNRVGAVKETSSVVLRKTPPEVSMTSYARWSFAPARENWRFDDTLIKV